MAPADRERGAGVEGLADLLLKQGIVDQPGLERARQESSTSGSPLSRTLVSLRLATEPQIVEALAVQFGVPFADCSPGAIDPGAARLLGRATATALLVLPVAFAPGGGLVVDCAEPDFHSLDRVAAETGMSVTGALAVRSDLQRAIDALTLDQPDPAPAPAVPPGRRPGAVNGRSDAPNGRSGGLAADGGPGGMPGERPGGGSGTLAYEEEPAVDLNEVLGELIDVGGSDLHLTAGSAPMVRLRGELVPLGDHPQLEPADLRMMLYGMLTQKQREVFENELELDLSYAVAGRARFRVNIFQQRDAMGAVMRTIPHEIRSLEDLGVPPQVANFCTLPRGFVLVTGPTGSGKSTTLAALIDLINRDHPKHIMTVEDPIEFLHAHKRSLVNQRELGTDTHSFTAALKHVLRQDPDVILVGELRDLETIQIALTAAETGHLVFGTLHTQDAPQTIDRIVDVFPPHQQEQIRIMLAGALQGVVCQQLLKTTDGKGRAAAFEVLVGTPAIRNLIREGKTHQMGSSIQAGKAHGMVSMDQSLATLVLTGKVAYADALERCSSPADFNRLCGKG